MTIWGTFDDHRILRTLITFWGIWGRFEYLLQTSEDFEGFENLLRKLRTFWGSPENLETARTLCTFCAFSWLFVDFVDLLRTFWRIDDLILSEHWRTFQKLLMTSGGPIEDLRPLMISRTFEDTEDLCQPDYLRRTLRTLINFWGLRRRFEYRLRTFEEFEEFDVLLSNLRIIWGPESWGRWGPFVHFLTFWGYFEDQLRPEGCEDLGYLLCIFLTFWGLCVPFEGFLKTWGPEDLKALKNFLDLLMTTCGPFEDCF